VAKPLNFLSKKVEEEATKELLKGDFEAFSKATRFYCFVLIFI
jgi:hypothetical protein